MATKKKAKKKPARSTQRKTKKATPRAKKSAPKKSRHTAKTTAQSSRKKTSKAASAKKSPARKAAKKKPATKAAAPPRKKAPGRADFPYAASQPEARSGRLSGDLQGLSSREAADSESVDELLEEGNAFEAGVVSGVEDSADDFKEVRTREVPEDDVPEEYLDDK